MFNTDVKETLRAARKVQVERARIARKADGLIEEPKIIEKTEYFNPDRKTTELCYYMDGLLESRWVYEYDKSGQKKERLVYDKDGLIERRIRYLYDSNQRNYQFMEYDRDMNLTEMIVHLYGEDGLVQEIDVYNHDKQIVGRWFYEYVSLENSVTKKVRIQKLGQPERLLIIKRNLSGKVVERTSYHGGKLFSRSFLDYNIEGKQIEERRVDGDGAIIGREVWEDDSNGQLAKQTSYGRNNKKKEEYAYFYEYDHIGNWIKETTWRLHPDPNLFTKYHPGAVIYRTIEYW